MVNVKNTFGISGRSYSLIIKTLKEYKNIEKAVIFGSRAMNNAKKGSDIDIAIYGNKIEPELIRKLKVLFNEKYNIPYFVDVIFYDDINNTQLKKHIDTEGKVLLHRVRKIKKKHLEKLTN